MSGRRLVQPASLAAVFGPLHGLSEPPEFRRGVACADRLKSVRECRRHQCGETRVGGARVGTESQPTARPAGPAKPAPRISPESFTITADDPGLQLLVARNSGGSDPRPDSSGRVDGRARGPWSSSSRAVICGRWARGRHGHGRAGWPDGRGADHDRAAIDSIVGFRRGHRAHLHPARDAIRGAATARPTVRTAFISRSSATTGRAIFRRWRATAARGGCRGWFPTESLFLAKATGTVPHGGGRRLLTAGSPEYQTLLAWVRDGARERRGKPHGRVVTSVGRAQRRPVWRAGPATAPRDGAL